jgi:hypothetical protein
MWIESRKNTVFILLHQLISTFITFSFEGGGSIWKLCEFSLLSDIELLISPLMLILNTPCTTPSTLKERDKKVLEPVDIIWYSLCIFLICNVNREASHHMQNVSWEYVSIIIQSERKSKGHEKLVTETFSAFYINISKY